MKLRVRRVGVAAVRVHDDGPVRRHPPPACTSRSAATSSTSIAVELPLSASSSSVATAWSCATGASLTGFTVMSTVPLALVCAVRDEERERVRPEEVRIRLVRDVRSDARKRAVRRAASSMLKIRSIAVRVDRRERDGEVGVLVGARPAGRRGRVHRLTEFTVTSTRLRRHTRSTGSQTLNVKTVVAVAVGVRCVREVAVGLDRGLCRSPAAPTSENVSWAAGVVDVRSRSGSGVRRVLVRRDVLVLRDRRVVHRGYVDRHRRPSRCRRGRRSPCSRKCRCRRSLGSGSYVRLGAIPVRSPWSGGFVIVYASVSPPSGLLTCSA